MAVREHGRARVLWRPPEQRRFGAGGMPGLLTMLLLTLVVFLGGIVIGRATMVRGRAGAAATPVTTAAAPATADPTASTVAPQGTAAAASQAAAAATGQVGPRRVEHGVGVDYAHTQQGAVAAAANYTRALSSSLILDDAKRKLAIATLAAPEAKARLQKTFDQAVASLRAGLGMTGAADDGTKVLLRATPVGWRVEEYGDGTAKIAIWVTSIGGSFGGAKGPVPIREGWGTTTVDLRWVKGDWKQLDTTTSEGPVPIADVAPPTAAPELVTKADEFKEFTYAPGS